MRPLRCTFFNHLADILKCLWHTTFARSIDLPRTMQSFHFFDTLNILVAELDHAIQALVESGEFHLGLRMLTHP